MAETTEKEQPVLEASTEQREARMYQLFYILPSHLAQEELLRAREGISQDLVKEGANITQSREPVKKRLAYPVAKQIYGFTGETTFWVNPASVQSISTALGQNEHLIRFSLAGQKEARDTRRQERAHAYASAQEGVSAEVSSAAQPQGTHVETTPAEKIEQQPRTFKEKISLEEIDKKLEEIMKNI